MKVHIRIVIVVCISALAESLFSSTVIQDEAEKDAERTRQPQLGAGPEDRSNSHKESEGSAKTDAHLDRKFNEIDENFMNDAGYYAPGYYDEHYPVDDSGLSGDERYFHDQPRNKKLEHPYIYNRRQAMDKQQPTSEVIIKQGRLRGIVRKMQPQSGLSDVDQYYGLPYAEAPIGNKRFMPPGAPPPWHGQRIAANLPPVCPQRLPNMEQARLRMSKGRYEQLEKILPYLKIESEDCLYLNLYVPRWIGPGQKPKFPVIVYIHGESFEWNSGNPYDGSVLASYGQVIVVTLNYRLGILGFMKPGISEHTVSNFGLLDQIAALQWVKDNIGSFGGDNKMVTLMGHSTGAACVNLLMVSPVAKGLFHRAILMSGSAMSDWATTNQSLQLTMQVLHDLNCPLHDANDEILTCLKKKRYQEIIKARTSTPEFSTSFGPVVDGLVIPNQPYKVMGQYTDLFSRYDLLFGVTEVESYHILRKSQLQDGIREKERDDLLRLYMQNRFEIRPDLALAATLKKYTDIYNNPIKASSQEHRDVVLDILSDARVVAPLIQTGIFHAKVNPRSYMYVFGHNSEAGDYANLPYSIVGEEIAFVFGAPLAAAGPFHSFYSIPERLLSEAVMLYWTNFAKTGNPKAPWRERFINLHPLEWKNYDIDWPEFNGRNQSYVNLGIPPSLGFRYRQIYMNYWNKELPDELNQIATMLPVPPFVHLFPPSSTPIPRGGTSSDPDDVITGHFSRYPVKQMKYTTEDPFRKLKVLIKDTHDTSGMYNAQPTYGDATDRRKVFTKENIPEEEVDRADSTIPILVGIVVLFLLLNAIAITTYVIRRNRKNKRVNRKLNILSYDGTNDDDLKRTKNIPDGDDSYVLDIVRKSNSFDTPKTTKHSPINGFKITRQLSSSTVDAHTKVSDWITQDKFSDKVSKKSLSPFSFRGRSLLKKPKKISVAIDATPQNRSDSVLRQEPIELTKQKTIDSGRSIIICQEVDIDADLINPDSDGQSTNEESCSGSSSSEPTELPLPVFHQHSRSDPVQMYYTLHNQDEQVTSFIDNGDINVTSRDKSVEKDPLSAEEQLQNIKRRNFPKVLPDYPGENDGISLAIKRRSLPAPNFTLAQLSKIPPAPPPRTISTLGSESQKRLSRSLMGTTEEILAEGNSEDEEPAIAQNTLIVGPLLPKNQESLYLTIKPKRADSTDTPKGSLYSLQHSESAKSLRRSGIKPPSSSSTTSLTSFQPGPKVVHSHSMPESPKLEQKVVFKPNNTVKTTIKANIPAVHTSKESISRIPHLRAIPITPSTTSSSSSNSTSDREKSSTAESSGSSETSSSTGTVRRVQDIRH